MRIITTKPALLEVLARLQQAIEDPTDLPALSHVLLQVAGGAVSLSATDLVIALRCDLTATDTVAGSVAVPWKRLADLVEHLPTEEATIELEAAENSQVLSVRSGRSRATIYGMHASEFPQLAFPASDAATERLSLSVASSQLAALLHKVAFAASTDGKQDPILAGILLYASGQSLTLTARDAHRLAACTASLQAAVPRDCAVVFPAGVAASCAQVLASVGPDAAVQIVIEETHAHLSLLLPGVVLSTRLTAGTYPMGFRRYVRPNYLTRIVVAKKHLADALRPLAPVAKEGGDLVTLTFAAAGEAKMAVTIVAESRDLGRQEETFDAVSLEGGNGDDLLLKYSQLKEILEVLDAPSLALERRGQDDPVAVRPVGGAVLQEETYVLAPCTRRQ